MGSDPVVGAWRPRPDPPSSPSRRQADHESLLDKPCELSNRRAFDDRFGELTGAHGQPGEPPLMVMLLDLDGLKAINDELGREADVALRMIAAALRRHLGEHDLPARPAATSSACCCRPSSPRPRCPRRPRVPRLATGSPTLPTAAGSRALTAIAPHLVRADQSLYGAERGGRDRVLMAS